MASLVHRARSTVRDLSWVTVGAWWPVVVVLPWAWFVLQLARAHWMPQGDEAIVGIHAHDVFSLNPPLQGMRGGHRSGRSQGCTHTTPGLCSSTYSRSRTP